MNNDFSFKKKTKTVTFLKKCKRIPPNYFRMWKRWLSEPSTRELHCFWLESSPAPNCWQFYRFIHLLLSKSNVMKGIIISRYLQLNLFFFVLCNCETEQKKKMLVEMHVFDAIKMWFYENSCRKIDLKKNTPKS